MKKIILFCNLILMFSMSACSSKQVVINNATVVENKVDSTYDLNVAIKNAKCVIEYQDIATIDDFDTVKFGKYEQDNNLDNDKEDIEWFVLDKKNGVATLVSKYILDAKQYDDKIYTYYERRNEGYWENCFLRKWLNKDFYDVAFDESEKNKIVEVENINPPAMNLDTDKVDGGNNTKDKVYLLCNDEYKKYFGFEWNRSNDKAVTSATPYAYSEFVNNYTLDETIEADNYIYKYPKWANENEVSQWLRSPYHLSYASNNWSGNGFLRLETLDFKGATNGGGIFCYIFADCNGAYGHEKYFKYNFFNNGVRPVINVRYDENYTSEEKNINVSEEKHIYEMNDIDKAYVVLSYPKNCSCEVMDTVLYGRYEQDGNIDNGKEKIEWLVLDKNDDEAFLLSKDVLFIDYFSDVLAEDVMWSESYLRKTLNNEFLNEAFNDVEKEKINITKTINYDNPVYFCSSGITTYDKCFILSFDEVIKYFGTTYDECAKEAKFYLDVEERNTKSYDNILAYATKYLQSEIKSLKDDDAMIWWLRNQGNNNYWSPNGRASAVMGVYDNIYIEGFSYATDWHGTPGSDWEDKSLYKRGVRPAIKVKLGD